MKNLVTANAAEDTREIPVLQLLLFRLEREQYAIPLSDVREVARYRQFTAVPSAPPVLPGIISQRGVILAIVDLRGLFNLDAAALTAAARFVIVQHGEVDMALIVEEVFDLIDVRADAIELVPGGADPARVSLLQGVVRYEDQPVALLDLDALVSQLREGGNA